MTAFERHVIVIDGEEWSMTTDPLCDFLAERGFQPVMRSTANWWGYTARWEVRDGGLHLTHLDGEQGVETGRPSAVVLPDGLEPAPSVERRALVPADLFGQDLPVLASWFSGTLYPERGLVQYVHAAWESTFAESRAVVVQQGRVVELGPIRSTGTLPPARPDHPTPRRSWWRRLLRR
jgi:hypothetical protein